MKKSIILSASICSLVLSACSTSGPRTEQQYPQTAEERRLEKMGKLTGEGIILFGGSKKRTSGSADAISVNAYLWRAALDVVHAMHMPLATHDPFGGVITTDWGTPIGNERFKLNILIIGAALRSDAVKISVFKQVKDSKGNWREAPANPQLAKDIENKILLRAREIKVASM